jgi:ABC-type transporter Mla MlaB component
VPGKITFRKNPLSTTLRLKGKLSGLWVDEVARTWCYVVTRSPAKSVTVDLAGVSFIDSEGIKLLRWLFEQGTHLRAGRLMTQYIIDRVAQEAGKPRRTRPSAAPATFRDSSETKPSSALGLAT